MKAVILAGGFGTRLRPITEGTPKPCVPIVGEPCIVRMVRMLASQGIREFHVTLFYLPEQIRAALAKEEFRDLSIIYHQETVPLGTAGAVKNSLSGCEEEFIVVSGDGVFDFDLTDAISFHRGNVGPVTIVTSKVDNVGEFGIVLCKEAHRISRFVEKPDVAHAYSDDVNTGIYICSPELLEYIPEGCSDFSKDVFPRLLKENVPIYSVPASGYWCDVGTVASYLDCNHQLLSFQGDEILSEVDGETVIESPCYIGKNVRLSRCHIGPYTVLGDGCELTGARVEGSVLHAGVVCEPGAEIRNAVLCKNSTVRANARVGDECVIGSDCDIGTFVTVASGVKIFPSNRIQSKSFLTESVHRKVRSLLPEEGRIYFPFGVDFGGAAIYEIGRAMAQLLGGDIVVGRSEQKDAASVMTFCGGVLSCGKNVYDTGANELSQFRFTVRNYAFRGGAFFQRNYSNLIVRLYDENGMPLSSEGGRKLLRLLSEPCACGESDGIYRVFRGGAKSYASFLRSFGTPSHLMMRVVSSPVLSPLLPRIPERNVGERMRVSPEWVRIEQEDGEPFDEELIHLAALISLGRLQSPVRFPGTYPYVTEQVGDTFGFRAVRTYEGDPYYRKLFPLTDPNVEALLILNLLEKENMSFSEFSGRLPAFSVKQRDVSVAARRGAVMKALARSGAELTDGIRIADRLGVVRIVPKENMNGFRIFSEAVNAEQAEELCDFYSMKLKGIKPD